MITANRPDEGTNELKELQDDLIQARCAVDEAARRWKAWPTPDNKVQYLTLARYAETLAAKLDALTGKVSDEIPW